MQGAALDPDRQWVVVDTDAGLDDAQALLYLLAQPDVGIIGVTTVFGNTSVENAARNVATVLDVAGRLDIPVYLGAAQPLIGRASIDSFWHGADGLGDRGLQRADVVLQHESAAEFLVRVANRYPGQVDLQLLGPLTNAARAIERDPDLLSKFRSIVLMGGGGPYPPVGTLPLTDANSHHDPAAAEKVYRARNAGNVVMVGINVTLKALLDEVAYETLRSQTAPWPQFAASVLDAYNDAYQYAWGRRVSAVHDGLASVILHRPEVATGWIEGPVTFTPTAGSLAVQVALTYDGRPLSFETPQGPSVRAVTQFDIEQFQQRFLDALMYGRAAPSTSEDEAT
jgi:purine nucleosidase